MTKAKVLFTTQDLAAETLLELSHDPQDGKACTEYILSYRFALLHNLVCQLGIIFRQPTSMAHKCLFDFTQLLYRSRPPYQADGGAATLSATDGQSLQPPAQHWDGATPGSSSQSEDGRPRPSNSDCDEASAAERQGGRLHSNSNVLEWQRRHSSVQKTEAGHKGMEQQR